MVVVIGAKVVRARLALPKVGLGLAVVDDGASASPASSSASVVAVVPRVEGVGRVKMFLRNVGMLRAGVRTGVELVVAGVLGVERRGFSLKRFAPTPPEREAGVVGLAVVLLEAGSSYSYSIISYSSSAGDT